MASRCAHGAETEQNRKTSLNPYFRNLPTHTRLNLRPSDLQWAQATPYLPLKTTVTMLRLEDHPSSRPLTATGEAKVVKMVDWSELPHDLIGKIAQKVEQVEDFISFSCVCVSWRANAFKDKWLSRRQLPWIVMSGHPHDTDHRVFYSLYTKRMFNLVLPEARETVFAGSTQGWIGITSKDNLQISLLNPLTRTVISLPPPGTFDPPLTRWYSYCLATKMVPFKVTDGFLVVAAFGPCSSLSGLYYQLGLFRPGNQAWTAIADGTTMFSDFTVLNGHLFAVDSYCTVYTCNLVGLGSPNPELFASTPSDWDRVHRRSFHLVNCLGDLLLVVRVFTNVQNVWKNVTFVVYKLDLETKNWIKVEKFQDYAIFLGSAWSMCLSSPEVADCRHNNIYFTDNYLPGRKMSVFSMEDKTFSPHYCSGDNVLGGFRTPLFFMPSFY